MKHLVLFAALVLLTCRPWDSAYENAIDGGLISVSDAGSDAGTDAGVDAGPLEIDAGVDAGPAAPDAGRCFDGGWCVSTLDAGLAPFFAGGGVWASGPDDAYVSLFSEQLLHWDGVRWSIIGLGPRSALANTVWGTSRDDVYVGLQNHETFHGPPFDQTIDGGPYEVRMIRGTVDGGAIYAVGDEWAVYRLDGTQRWQRIELGIAAPSSLAEMRALEVVSDDEVWLVGRESSLLHTFNGTDWVLEDKPTWNVNRVFAAGRTDVWFAGAGGHVLRWDGSMMRTQDCGPCGNIVGLWGRGSNDMWLYSQNATLVHWDGQTYAVQPAIAMNAVTSSGTAGLWGAGDFDLFFTSFDTNANVLAYHLIR